MFLVVSRGLQSTLLEQKSFSLVELAGPQVVLEHPQAKPERVPRLCHLEQPLADASALRSRFDVQMLNPPVLVNDESDHSPLSLSDLHRPGLNDAPPKAFILIFAVKARQIAHLRSRPMKNLEYRGQVRRCGYSDGWQSVWH